MLTRRAFFATALAAAAAHGADHKVLPYQADPNWPQLPPGWNFQETPGVAVDAKDHVYVLHRGEHPLIELTPDGRVVRSWGEGLFIRPHAVRIDPAGYIWVVDNDTHQILKMDPSGRVRLVMGRKGQSGEGPNEFNRPTDVAFTPDGTFYVSDGYVNSRVAKFTKDGKFIKAWGKKGKEPGNFDLPHSVIVGPDGRVYVGDRENYRLQVFDPDGKFLEQWTDVGSPWGLALSRDNSLFLTDGYNNRILKCTLDGKILGQVASAGKTYGHVDYAHHIAVDSKENVYVAEIKNWRVQKFVRQ
jgi:DNA-binding beta-propeller fold protein YncE